MWAARPKSGFTLIELIIVITVIAILVVVSVVVYNGVQRGARDNALLSDLANVESEVTRYSTKNNGQYGSAVAWYSANGPHPNISVTPSEGNIIDVVSDATRYCIRGYNVGSNYPNIHQAALKQSGAGVCDELEPSAAALAESPDAPDIPLPDIEFVAATGGSTGSITNTTMTLSVPSDVEDGDILLASIQIIEASSATTAALNTPPGWNLLATQHATSPHRIRQGIYYRVADNEPASYSFASAYSNGSSKMAGVMGAYRYVNTDDPIVESALTQKLTSGTTASYGSLTPNVKGFVVTVGGGRGSSTSLGSPNVGAYTLRQAANTTASSWMNAYIADGGLVQENELVSPPAVTYSATTSSLFLGVIILRAL